MTQFTDKVQGALKLVEEKQAVTLGEITYATLCGKNEVNLVADAAVSVSQGKVVYARDPREPTRKKLMTARYFEDAKREAISKLG